MEQESWFGNHGLQTPGKWATAFFDAKDAVNSGIDVPGSHPTPSSFWGLWYFFWVGIGWFSSSSMEALLLLAAMHSCNECIIREGERRETRLPPFRMIIIATLRFLGFRPGTESRCTPYTMCSRSVLASLLSSGRSSKRGPEWGEQGATVLSRKCVGHR